MECKNITISDTELKVEGLGLEWPWKWNGPPDLRRSELQQVGMNKAETDWVQRGREKATVGCRLMCHLFPT